MKMQVSDRGLVELAAHEGIVLSPYRDSVGVWTIGVGHTAAAGPPDPATLPRTSMSLHDIMALFRNDVEKYAKAVNDVVKVPLLQHEFDALVSFHYNTGAIRRASFVKKLNKGDKAGAASGMMAWKKPASIIPRRQKEQALFRDGVYSAKGYANQYQADSKGRIMWRSAKKVNVLEKMSKVIIPPVNPKPLGKSRTMRASALAGIGAAGSAMQDTAYQVQSLSDYSEIFKWVFLGLMVAGIGLVIYARWDDSREREA